MVQRHPQQASSVASLGYPEPRSRSSFSLPRDRERMRLREVQLAGRLELTLPSTGHWKLPSSGSTTPIPRASSMCAGGLVREKGGPVRLLAFATGTDGRVSGVRARERVHGDPGRLLRDSRRRRESGDRGPMLGRAIHGVAA